MHLAYIDDSGDENTMALGAVLVPADRWLEVHDNLVAFRSALSKNHGFRMRSELKASQLVTRGGPWRRLTSVNMRSRMGIYKAALRELDYLAPAVRTVAVVIPDRLDSRLQATAIEEAWEVLLQRLERFCHKNSTHCLMMPDDGNPLTVRRLARRKRRFGYAPAAFGGPGRKVPFRQLVDDPVHRNSSHSYLMQWADLVAHAAFRTVLPRADVPPNLWAELGEARLHEANGLRTRNEPPGVIVWPSRTI